MSATLAAPSTKTVADLLLVRLALPNASPKKVRADLGKLLDAELSAAAFDELRSELTQSGFLKKDKRNTYVLTDAGRERAVRFLGTSELPSGASWSKVIAKYLFPKAAGLSESKAAKLNDGEKLVAFILKNKYNLAAGSTLNQVVEALACKELGFPNETTLQGVLSEVLSRFLGTERLPKDKLVKQIPLFKTGLKSINADAARCKVIRDWIENGSATAQPSAPQTEPFDLETFARTVKALAASSPPEDRFYDNKVFIAALWRASRREPSFPCLTLPEFKQRLIEANTRHLLHLSRADFVQAMDPQLVADSEIVHLNATFHFVLLEGDRP